MRPSVRPFFCLPLLALALSGCSSAPTLSFFPGVHRIAVLQGNIVTQGKVDQLRLGMTRNQVIYLLGTPLINDPFHLDHWNYLYSRRDPNGSEARRELKVTFEDGVLVLIEGDYAPSSAEEPSAEEPSGEDFS